MPPTLTYLFSTAKIIAGGSSMITEQAITEPQSVAFCWKKVCRPIGRVKMLADRMKARW